MADADHPATRNLGRRAADTMGQRPRRGRGGRGGRGGGLENRTFGAFVVWVLAVVLLRNAALPVGAWMSPEPTAFTFGPTSASKCRRTHRQGRIDILRLHRLPALPFFVPAGSPHPHGKYRLVKELVAKRTVEDEEADPSGTERSAAASVSYEVRDCAYAELGAVADLILSSFYDATQSPWRQLYRMGELNRIQQGFAYPASRDQHRMLVAVVPTPTSTGGAGGGKVIGFCDVDDRPPNRPTGFASNPRPYLSDLCTDPDHRRRGVAKALVEQCETYCRETLRRTCVYIRVETHNVAALRLYKGMGYRIVDDEELDAGPVTILRSDPASEKIRLLRKDLLPVSSTAAVLVDQLQQVSTADQGLG